MVHRSHPRPVLDLAADVRAIAGKLKRRLREHGSLGDLPPSQVAALARLERDGAATVSGLARAEGMRPQSMGVTVAALQATGLVSGTADPNDGRRTILALTQSCRDRIAAGRAARQDWLEQNIRAELTQAEQEQLATGLALLDRVLDR